MNLKSDVELENTREKLRMLVEHYEKRRQERVDNPHLRDLSLRSIKRLINQLTEEIARYEAHAAIHSRTGDSV